MNIIERTYSLNGGLSNRNTTNRIILHHAAASNCSADDVDRWHKNKGWTCIGYHFFVRKDGSIYRGRREEAVGAHAYGSNTDSIGICAEGNFENETMGDVQKQALKELVAYLKNKYGITKVQRHRDVNATACPGKNYPFEEIANATVKSTENKPIENKTEGYLVKVTANALNIRAGAGTNYNIVGCIRDKGTYTIIETQGNWGKLKSGAGWICLEYTSKGSTNSNTSTSACDPVVMAPVTEVGGGGTATIVASAIKFRDHYCTHCGTVQGTYNKGESVNYDKKCYTEKYVWISWISTSTGKRRWMPIKDKRTGEVWATVR